MPAQWLRFSGRKMVQVMEGPTVVKIPILEKPNPD
jgi:hypothetical protein